MAKSALGLEAPGVLVLGSGAVAEIHAQGLRAAGARLVAVAGPDLHEVGEFAQRHEIPHASDDPMASMSQGGFQGVVIASPSPVHAAQASAALHHGHHVLVEIPLALSLDDAEALVQLSRLQERTLMVSHTLRYSAPFEAARRFLSGGSEVPVHVMARTSFRRRRNIGWTGRRRDWTDDLLWHHGGHIVDAALGFLEDPVAIVRSTAGPISDVSGRPMDYSISLRTTTGRIGSIALSYNDKLGASDLQLISINDTIQIAGTTVRTSDRTLFAQDDDQSVLHDAIGNIDADFVEAMRSGRPPLSDATSVLPSFRVLQAIEDQAHHDENATDA